MPTPLHRTDRRDARGGIATIVVVALVVVAAAGFAGYWFLIRSDAAGAPTISKTKTVSGGNIDGTWTLTANDGQGSFAQYRVHEQFAAGLVDNEATGKTTDVTGSLTVDGTKISEVTVTANLAQLKSDKDFRDNALHTRGLETDKFPTAKFVATGSITLPSTPAKGTTIKIDVPGELTLHGVTQSVTMPLEGRWDGATIQVVGVKEIKMSDYGITPPTGGPIAEVDDHGSLELKLFFTKSG